MKKKQFKKSAFTCLLLLFLPVSEIVSAWAIQEHEEITSLAYEQVVKKNSIPFDSKVKKSLKKGATLNDMYDNNPASFAAKYLSKSDEFINQSHHESMQFLHMMQNGEALEKTIEKSLMWIQLCLEVYQNKNKLDKTTLLNYVAKSNETVQEMLTRLLVKQSCNNLPPIVPTSAIIEQLKENPKMRSEYANLTFKEFFQVNDKVDYRFVALGSAMHVIEDRFANSHAQSSLSTSSEIVEKQQSCLENGIEPSQLSEVTQPIVASENYRTQDANLHAEADNFTDSVKYAKVIQTKKGIIEQSYGGVEALLSATYLLQAAVQKKDIPTIIKTLKTSCLRQDKNSLALGHFQAATTEEEQLAALKGSVFEGIALEFIPELSVTDGGRQYEKTDWAHNEPNSIVRSELQHYLKLLKRYETDTKKYDSATKIQQLREESTILTGILQSKKASKETNVIIKKHLTEILIHLDSLKTESSDSGMKTQIDELISNIVQAFNQAKIEKIVAETSETAQSEKEVAPQIVKKREEMPPVNHLNLPENQPQTNSQLGQQTVEIMPAQILISENSVEEIDDEQIVTRDIDLSAFFQEVESIQFQSTSITDFFSDEELFSREDSNENIELTASESDSGAINDLEIL